MYILLMICGRVRPARDRLGAEPCAVRDAECGGSSLLLITGLRPWPACRGNPPEVVGDNLRPLGSSDVGVFFAALLREMAASSS
ncbi:hypothetical protein Q5P01_006866 [Channa striata]|uniref:Uncharacterized protein n=1 Tax=Channa striata TaxID=64152 RepID=A0AA88NBS2_CHASR|nr:hypothetical protein Q5P01_006866 [Channa striata]